MSYLCHSLTLCKSLKSLGQPCPHVGVLRGVHGNSHQWACEHPEIMGKIFPESECSFMRRECASSVGLKQPMILPCSYKFKNF